MVPADIAEGVSERITLREEGQLGSVHENIFISGAERKPIVLIP